MSRLADAAYKRESDLQDAAKKAFAQRNGWRYTPKQRAANFNYPVLDHVDSFLDENGKRVARVTHSYAPFEEIARFAEANGLIAQRLPWSWWNPDPRRFYWRAYDCIAVLLLPAEANEALR